MGTGAIGGLQCQDVDQMGRDGRLTEDECLAAQLRAAGSDDPCGCNPPTPCKFYEIFDLGNLILTTML